MLNKKLGISEITEEVNWVIGRVNAVDFKLKTMGLLKGFFCCLIFR